MRASECFGTWPLFINAIEIWVVFEAELQQGARVRGPWWCQRKQRASLEADFREDMDKTGDGLWVRKPDYGLKSLLSAVLGHGGTPIGLQMHITEIQWALFSRLHHLALMPSSAPSHNPCPVRLRCPFYPVLYGSCLPPFFSLTSSLSINLFLASFFPCCFIKLGYTRPFSCSFSPPAPRSFSPAPPIHPLRQFCFRLHVICTYMTFMHLFKLQDPQMRKIYNYCLSEIEFICLMWSTPVVSPSLRCSPCGCVDYHCVPKPHYRDPPLCWLTPRLFP